MVKISCGEMHLPQGGRNFTAFSRTDLQQRQPFLGLDELHSAVGPSLSGSNGMNSLPDNLRNPLHCSSCFRRDLKTALFTRY